MALALLTPLFGAIASFRWCGGVKAENRPLVYLIAVYCPRYAWNLLEILDDA